ncbi:hypothetical protein AK812_SmicGene45003, partial [Symbiodinium microadriaticum]
DRLRPRVTIYAEVTKLRKYSDRWMVRLSEGILKHEGVEVLFAAVAADLSLNGDPQRSQRKDQDKVEYCFDVE